MGHGYPVSRRSGVPAAPPCRHVPSVTAVAAGGDLINYVALAAGLGSTVAFPHG